MLLFDRELLLYNTIFGGNMKNNINKLLLITISIVFLTFSILTPSISAETYTKEIQNSENLQTKITYGYADEENSSFIITEEITTLSLKEALDSWIKSGNDKNASYELLPFDPSELENIPNITANFLPEYTFLLNYTAEDGSIQQIKYYIKSEIGEYVDDSEKFQTYAVDTIFDIAAFSISLNEYKKNKTFWNGFWVNSFPRSVWKYRIFLKSFLMEEKARYTSAASLFGPVLCPMISRLKRSTNTHTYCHFLSTLTYVQSLTTTVISSS
jgi:hypothetical protein